MGTSNGHIAATIVANIKILGITWVICSGLYPLLIWAIAQVSVPESANGSLLRSASGQVVGSRLIAQKFTRPEYFWPRPSAVDYNAGGSGGSNLSPANAKITERATELMSRLFPEGIPPNTTLPAELVTTSGSGLDPHLSRRGILVQGERVSRARSIAFEKLRTWLRKRGVYQGARSLSSDVNVLELNMALDKDFPLKKNK
jgi:K+-transporting ATPase ATPase C chain